MFKYEVTIDGERYQVNSDQELTEQQAYQQALMQANQVEVRTAPDLSAFTNTIMELPDGTRFLQDVQGKRVAVVDPEGVADINQETARARLAQEFRRNRDIALAQERPFTAGVVKTLQSIPYVGEGVDELIGAMGGDTETVRSLRRGVEEGFPVQSALGRTAGIATALPIASRLPALNTGSKTEAAVKYAGTGTLFGAGEGASSGYLAGEGGPTDPSRIRGLQSGATWGAALGLPLGAAGGFVQQYVGERGLRALGNDIAKRLEISPDAGVIIAQSLNLGVTLEEALQNIRRAGDQGMIADADIAVQRLLGTVSNLGSPQAARNVQVVPERARAQSESLSGYMDEALGPTPIGQQTSMEAARRRTAGPRQQAYDEAFATPIDYASPAGIQLETVLKRVTEIEPKVMSQAIEEANKEMRMQGISNQQIMADIAEDGSITFKEMPNLRQVDEIKKALQNIANQSTDQFGRISSQGRRYAQLATEVRNAAVDAVPTYGRALELGQSTIREQGALATSGSLLRRTTSVEDVLGLVRGADLETRRALQTSLRMEIDNLMGEVRTSFLQGGDAQIKQANKLLTEIFAPNNVKKMKLILGDEGYAALRPKLDEVASALNLQGQIREGSQTAARQAVGEQIEATVRGGVLESLKRGEVPGSLKGIIQKVTGATDEMYGEKANELLGDVVRGLTEKRGADAEAALRYIQEALSGQQLNEAKQAFIVNTARRGLVSAVREQKPEDE